MKTIELRPWPCHSRMWIIALWIVLLSACQGQPIPDSMIDTWVTDDPRYEKCLLKITPARIIFGDPEGNRDESYIKGVSATKKGQVTEVTIRYVNSQDVTMAVELLYTGNDGGRISLKNQMDVMWERAEKRN
jgi:hypothetical protein